MLKFIKKKNAFNSYSWLRKVFLARQKLTLYDFNLHCIRIDSFLKENDIVSGNKSFPVSLYMYRLYDLDL